VAHLPEILTSFAHLAGVASHVAHPPRPHHEHLTTVIGVLDGVHTFTG
jgi:hypothetical protein